METIQKANTIIIKIGSAQIVEANGTLRRVWIASLAEDVAKLQKQGKHIILVCSGAVALGRSVMGFAPDQTLKLEEKQACAACGQIRLMEVWQQALAEHQKAIAQLLLTLDISDNRRRYLNARTTLRHLLEHGVIPIINENDTTATTELRVGDNDRLAARVAQMVDADMLILLSDIDGLYTADPNQDKDANHVRKIETLDDSIRAMAGDASTSVGTGGMQTKLDAAEIALSAGCHMIITKGEALHPLRALEEGAKHSWFVASTTPNNARKQWISGALQPLGEITIDPGAEKALLSGNSLLPVGVVSITGQFERGDAVIVKSEKDISLAKGLVAYKSEEALKIKGHNSSDIEKILGYQGRDALIHRGDLVML